MDITPKRRKLNRNRARTNWNLLSRPRVTPVQSRS